MLVTRVGCHNGVTGVVEEPEIGVRSDRVIVTFVVTPGKPGSARCQGNPEVPFLKTLPDPLGNRLRTDGRCPTDDDVASTAFCAHGGRTRS